ncbi:hypothetical protein LMG1231_05912 [Achromobacter denitrificans]|nr:hypothetical protein LMG1231_05912 [Achromobacter denitrificans]
MAARFVQRTQHGAVDEDPAAQGQRQGNRQHHDGDGARYPVGHRRLRDQIIGGLVHERQDFAHGFSQCRVRRAARVVQVQVVLHRHGRQRRRLALEQTVELLVGVFQLGAHGLRTRQARRLAVGVERLGAFLHQAFGALGLRGCLLGLALLHVHQGGRQQQAAAQEQAVGSVQLRRLRGIGVVDLVQLLIAGIQADPRHAIGYEHGAREEQQHQDQTGANFQIDKHEISERLATRTHTTYRARNHGRPGPGPAASVSAPIATPLERGLKLHRPTCG